MSSTPSSTAGHTSPPPATPGTDTPSSLRKPRGALRRLLRDVCWLATLPLAVLAILRLLHLDGWRYVVLVETFTNVVFLPAYLALLGAMVLRARGTALLALFVVVCHVGFVAPEMRPAGAAPHEVAAQPRLRLFTHNALAGNRTPEQLAQGVLRSHADVAFFQEVSWTNLKALRADSALRAQYPYSYATKQLGTDGMAIWSRFAIEDPETIETPYFPTVRAFVTVGEQRLRIYNVHVASPLIGDGSTWRRSWTQLHQQTRAETGPMLVAGDFNSVYAHRPYRDFLTDGFRDAHIERGRGAARTWPVDRSLGVRAKGYIRIDHVVTGPGVRATSIEEGPGDGSDHRSVVADLAIG